MEEVPRNIIEQTTTTCKPDLMSILEELASRSKTTNLWVDMLIKPVFIMMVFIRAEKEGKKKCLFNNTFNTFYLQLYGIRHMVKDHSDSNGGNITAINDTAGKNIHDCMLWTKEQWHNVKCTIRRVYINAKIMLSTSNQ